MQRANGKKQCKRTHWINHSYKHGKHKAAHNAPSSQGIDPYKIKSASFLKTHDCCIHAPAAYFNMKYYRSIVVHVFTLVDVRVLHCWLVPYNIVQMHDTEHSWHKIRVGKEGHSWPFINAVNGRSPLAFDRTPKYTHLMKMKYNLLFLASTVLNIWIDLGVQYTVSWISTPLLNLYYVKYQWWLLTGWHCVWPLEMALCLTFALFTNLG